MANIPTWFKETENILGVPKTKSLNLREDLMSKYSVTFRMLLKHKITYQNWVHGGQIFSWTWLGSVWSCLILVRNDQKSNFQTQARPSPVEITRLRIVFERVHRGSSSILKVIFGTRCRYILLVMLTSDKLGDWRTTSRFFWQTSRFF